MKKDIDFPKVEDIAIAVIPEGDIWVAYMINLKDKVLKNVIIASKGYGTIDGREVETSVLRHMFEEVQPESYVKIEPIQKKLVAISNEFWVSFWAEGKLQDKKYVFVTESIIKQNLVDLPLINQKGVMIK